jgi:hypothetical protein
MKSENVMNLHEDFFKSLKNEKTSLQDEKRLSAFSIENDTECLRKVKRIRNEIMMISNVLHAQRGVFETASGIAEKEMKTWKTTKSGTHHPWEDLVDARTIYTFCDRIKRLDDDAQRVEDSVQLT